MARVQRIEASILWGAGVVGGLLWSIAWGSLGYVGLLMRPPIALLWIALTMAAVLSYPWLLGSKRRRRRAAAVGHRGIGAELPWVLLAIPTSLLTTLFGAVITMRLAARPGPVFLDYHFASLPLGSLVIPLWAIALMPYVEEMGLRGFVMGRVRRRFGRVVAVIFAAALFAGLHGSLPYVPYYFAAGLLFGYARLTTRSVLTPIVLHASANALLFGLPAGFVAFMTWAHDRSTAALTLGLALAALGAVMTLHEAGAAERRRRCGRATIRAVRDEPSMPRVGA